MSASAIRDCRVVQLHTSGGPLSVELYDNFCADAFWQLANSGQLQRLVFRQLLSGFAVVGEVDDVCARCTSAADIAQWREDAAGAASALRHVGAGLLSCSVEVGTAACSRFLLTLAPQPGLDGSHVVFGRVYSGIHTVESMTKMQVDAGFHLYTPVTVLKCSTTLLPRGALPTLPEIDKTSSTKCTVRSVSRAPLLSLLE